MKTLFITLLMLLLTPIAQAQLQQLVIENIELGQTHVLNQGQQVRLVTNTGQKYKGKMYIVDAQTISVDHAYIAIANIDKIKKHSKIVAILSGIVVAYLSVGLIGGGIAVALLIQPATGVVMTAAGVMGMYGAINGINLHRSYKHYKGWTYRVADQVKPVAMP